MAQVERARAAVNDTTCGLFNYQLKPKYLKGEDILQHMVQHRLCNPAIKSHGPITYLDVMCTGEQLEYLGQDATDLTASKIMIYSHGQATAMKLTAQPWLY
jgi:hypothetical protein